MASKNFTGYLRSSLGDYADHDIWRFTHISTTGEVVAGSAAQFKVDSSGFYDIDVEYGNVVIESKNSLTRRWFNHGVTTINSDTSVTTLPALLNALVPASDSVILQMQSLLSDAESAKNDALQAKADTESLFNNFDASVADSVSRVGAFEPDVYIPFNDSLEIVRGYGTHDQIDVSAAQDGSVMVDLPTVSVEFSRASQATFINKSGQFKVADIDELRIESKGALIEDGSTNHSIKNQNPAEWPTTNGTATLDGVDFLGYGSSVNCVASGTGIFRIYANSLSDSITVNAGDYVTSSIYVKKGNTQEVRLRFGGESGFLGDTIIDFVNGVRTGGGNLPFKIERLDDGWYRVAVTYQAVGDDSVYWAPYLAYGTGQVSDPAAGTYLYVMFPQSEPSSLATSVILTDSSVATRSPDVLSTHWVNNMKTNDKTVMVDFSLLGEYEVGSNARRHIYSSSGVGVAGHYDNFYLYATTNEVYSVRTIQGDSGSEFGFDLTKIPPKESQKAALRVEDGMVSMGANGEMGAPQQRENFVNFSNLWLGSQYGTSRFLNGHLREFTVYHRALTDDEIKAKGAAK